MYLFTRRVRVRSGSVPDAMAWATGIAEKAQQITGLDIGVYTETWGPEVGSTAFTTLVPDLAALEAAGDKLAVDNAYLDLVTQGQQFAPDGASDRLLRIVHPSPEELLAAPEAPPPSYASVVTTSARAGSFKRAVELGVEIAQRATAVSGQPTLFLVDTTGIYGGVNWMSGYADVQALEAAETAIQMDESFAAFIDSETKGVYADDPGALRQLVYRRIN